MTYTVSITSQGQISIPMPLRKKLGLEKAKKAVVYGGKDGSIIVEPILDLLSLEGAVSTTKKTSSQEIREGFGDYLAKRKRK